jgi:phosphoacetylglucosamine mutase
MNVEKVIELLQTYPLLDETTNYEYGTAGFRFKVEHLDGILLRVGIASAYLLQEEDMGVMVTASHNDETYNGVKLSSPDGSMIPSDLEHILVRLVNERNLNAWRHQLQQQQAFSSTSSTFHVGYDTRSHSKRLTNLFVQGSQAMGVTVKNHGILTTPMLHHIVLHSNPKYLPSSIPPCPSRQGYTKAMAKAYLELLQEVATAATTTTSETLLVDCACGVGYKAVQEVVALLEKKCSIIPLNQPGEGPLNTNCGSEHVQKQLQPPTWYKQQQQQQQTTPPASQNYCCSVDGDADRIVCCCCFWRRSRFYIVGWR